jgi:23S rRNA (guanine2445-N2)-methyltransferase / 23S rRNA (guanine2069-N7)-methyltransferase
MRLLDKQGVLVFSNNLRKFSLDDAVTSKFDVQEITDKTIDQDFKRNAGIHHCWIIRGTH